MKPKTILISLGVAAAFLVLGTRKAFANVVNDQQFRGCDGFGCGAFGESRTGHSHQGVDIVVKKGQQVVSPISGTVTRFPFPYGDDLRYTGIEIKNNQYSIKIFYVNPVVSIGTKVSRGEGIATAQDIAAKYGNGMTNHIHIEVRETNTGLLLDPTKLF